MPHSFSLAVVILGAGASSRMGQPKLLLPWGDTSVLGQQVRQWNRLGARQVAVVHATHDQHIIDELERLNANHRIPNPDRDRGMFSSIRCAASWPWESDLTHWAIVLGDQPHLKDTTLQSLLDFATDHPGHPCQPVEGGHGRHPVILPKSAFLSLQDSTHPNLRQHLKSLTVLRCPMDDPELALDIDRPEDYQRALTIAGLTSMASQPGSPLPGSKDTPPERPS